MKDLFKLIGVVVVVVSITVLTVTTIRQRVPKHLVKDTATFTRLIYDTLRIETFDTVFIPKISYRDTGSTKYKVILKDIDTAALINKFLQTRVYDDTLKDDTIAFIRVIDTVAYNELQGRRTYFEARYVSSTTTTTIVNQGLRKQFLWGIDGGFNELSPVLGYDYGKGIIELKYNVLENGQVLDKLKIGYRWKIIRKGH